MAELCPKGAYTGRVLKQGLFESAGKGTLEFKVWVEVFRSADHGDLPKPFRRTAVEYITDGTLVNLMPKLRNLGFEGNNLMDLVPGADGKAEQDLTGMEITVLCQHDPYNGTLKEKWGIGKYSPGESMLKPASADKIAMWSARIAAMSAPPAASASVPVFGEPEGFDASTDVF